MYMLQLILHQFSRVAHALEGITYATLHDKSFQLQVLGGILILPLFVWLFFPLSEVEFLFLGLGWALVLITELQNSSFEEALDHLHPELHEKIGTSKDMASGSVLLAGFFLLFVMIVIALT